METTIKASRKCRNEFARFYAIFQFANHEPGRDGFHSVPDLARAALRRKDQGRSGIRPYRFMAPTRVQFWRLPLPNEPERRTPIRHNPIQPTRRIGVRRSAIGFMATTRVQSLRFSLSVNLTHHLDNFLLHSVTTPTDKPEDLTVLRGDHSAVRPTASPQLRREYR